MSLRSAPPNDLLNRILREQPILVVGAGPLPIPAFYKVEMVGFFGPLSVCIGQMSEPCRVLHLYPE